MNNRRSFFERLTGAVRLEEENSFDQSSSGVGSGSVGETLSQETDEAELAVDVYNTPSAIVIRTMVPGVKPDSLDVSITRDLVTIRGERSEDRTVSTEDYIHRELYWGSFAREISLPEEISVDDAEAVEKHGLLTLRLPKVDKHRQTRLRVKGN